MNPEVNIGCLLTSLPGHRSQKNCHCPALQPLVIETHETGSALVHLMSNGSSQVIIHKDFCYDKITFHLKIAKLEFTRQTVWSQLSVSHKENQISKTVKEKVANWENNFFIWKYGVLIVTQILWRGHHNTQAVEGDGFIVLLLVFTHLLSLCPG